MKQDLGVLKEQYIGKTFNWLTVLDIYKARDKHNHLRTYCKCQCKCGNTKDISLRYVLSGHTVSCGCYVHSKERAKHLSNAVSDWCKINPDKVKSSRSNAARYWQDHYEELIKRGAKVSKWAKTHTDDVKIKNQHISEANIEYAKHKRVCSDFSELLDLTHPECRELIISGEASANTIIKTRCPICGEYSDHNFGNVWRLNESKFRFDHPPMCSRCRSQLTSSKAEQEINNFIKSFYSGMIIRNTREIIYPLELDIYMPEKKIAIEFNGDYWHNEDHKDKDYHTSKYRLCASKNILLISIFESKWNNDKDKIKSYIKDLFNDRENDLSFSDDRLLMNNNYPSVNKRGIVSNIIEDFYIYEDKKIYTCGYSKII